MKRIGLLVTFLLVGIGVLLAQKQKLRNIPYVDQRRFHYGFCLGLNMSDISFEHNATDWWAECTDLNPAFCVGLLGDLALTERLNVRCTPMLYFQQRDVRFRNYLTGETRTQGLKSNYLEIPLSLKVSTHRLNNYRPYLLFGVNVDIDLAHEKETPIVFNRLDYGIHLVVGCDSYLPFFKFCPELRFHLGLADMLDHKRRDLKDETLMPFTSAISKARNKGISLIFFFE